MKSSQRTGGDWKNTVAWQESATPVWWSRRWEQPGIFLAESQAFFDGNKRVAITAAIMFLARNGWAVSPSASDALYDAMIGLAKHEFTKADLAALLKRTSSPVT